MNIFKLMFWLGLLFLPFQLANEWLENTIGDYDTRFFWTFLVFLGIVWWVFNYYTGGEDEQQKRQQSERHP